MWENFLNNYFLTKSLLGQLVVLLPSYCKPSHTGFSIWLRSGDCNGKFSFCLCISYYQSFRRPSHDLFRITGRYDEGFIFKMSLYVRIQCTNEVQEMCHSCTACWHVSGCYGDLMTKVPPYGVALSQRRRFYFTSISILHTVHVGRVNMGPCQA